MKKNVIVLLLIVIMASCSIGTVPVMAAEIEAGDVVDSGTCGETAAWTLTGTEDNLILTISGMETWPTFQRPVLRGIQERLRSNLLLLKRESHILAHMRSFL